MLEHPNAPLMLASAAFAATLAEYLHQNAFLEEDVDTKDMRARLDEILLSHHHRNPLPGLSLAYVEDLLALLEHDLTVIQEKGLDYWHGSSAS